MRTSHITFIVYMSQRRQFKLSLCQNELADDNNVLVFRPEHIHGHWLEIKILNESVDIKTTPISNMNSIHEPFLLFEHKKIKAMHSLPWLRVGWIVFYEIRETASKSVFRVAFVSKSTFVETIRMKMCSTHRFIFMQIKLIFV